MNLFDNIDNKIVKGFLVFSVIAVVISMLIFPYDFDLSFNLLVLGGSSAVSLVLVAILSNLLNMKKKTLKATRHNKEGTR